jgi:hypothetical protein
LSKGKSESKIVVKWSFELLIKPMTKSTTTISQEFYVTLRGYKEK